MMSNGLKGAFFWTTLYGLVAAGIVHICATFATPYLMGTGAYDRLIAELPANRLVVLGTPKPGAQLLPFQDPHMHYAFCHYDAREAPVLVKASLLSSGWTLALYSAGGDNFYVLPGRDQRTSEVSALLVPPSDQFGEMLPEQTATAVQALFPTQSGTGRGPRTASQTTAAAVAQVEVPSPVGLLVIRAPVKGEGYRSAIESALAGASCTRLPVSPTKSSSVEAGPVSSSSSAPPRSGQ